MFFLFPSYHISIIFFSLLCCLLFPRWSCPWMVSSLFFLVLHTHYLLVDSYSLLSPFHNFITTILSTGKRANMYCTSPTENSSFCHGLIQPPTKSNRNYVNCCTHSMTHNVAAHLVEWAWLTRPPGLGPPPWGSRRGSDPRPPAGSARSHSARYHRDPALLHRAPHFINTITPHRHPSSSPLRRGWTFGLLGSGSVIVHISGSGSRFFENLFYQLYRFLSITGTTHPWFKSKSFRKIISNYPTLKTSSILILRQSKPKDFKKC